MVDGETPLMWCNFDEMIVETWGCPNDTDLSWLQHLNLYKKEICKSITWQRFITLYIKDGFLIKSRTTQPYGQTLVVFVPVFLKVLWWTVGMPGFEKSGWFEVLAYTCAKSTGCLCSYFTVNFMVLFVAFSRELLCRQTLPPPPHCPHKWWRCWCLSFLVYPGNHFKSTLLQ